MSQAAATKAKAGPRSALDHVCVWLACACGIGRIKVAPGTWGSLPGLPLGVGLGVGVATLWPDAAALQVGAVVVVLALVTLFAYAVIARTERVTGLHDAGSTVIDEVAGQMIAATVCRPAWPWIVAAFALFRFFDITKPSLIGWLDREGKGAFGTLGDDIVAGLVAAAILGVARVWL
jgi:phosphatidylglycerophosphatase A